MPAPETPQLVSLARNLANQRWAEERLVESEERYRIVAQTALDAIVTVDQNGEILFVNPSAERIFGYTSAEMLKQNIALLLPGYLLGAQAAQPREMVGRHKDGHEIALEASFGEFLQGSKALATGILRDITDRKRLETQLRQAQKMEAVGRLAGGIAHDFNNLMTVITGFDEMLLNSLPADSRARAYALEIQQAGEKAAALTKQLLAFSRQQVAHPTLLNINPVVTTMSNMLRRLIGEHIELSLVLNPEVGMVEADPGQVEQIIVNLVVNARDAIVEGGRITVETGIADLDENYVQTHFNVRPGRYVSLSVSDTGAGMTQDTKNHLFEPFFTTKEEGKGTGLGLSTIYGIVKQNGGDIWIYSEPGKGSTFKVYLPAADAEPDAVAPESDVIQRGSETILLVEDESRLREMTQEVLQRLGYTVLAAANSDEAIRMSSIHPGNVHLLLTDVVMPKANGGQLAGRLRRLRKNTRVLYMSGYPAETALQHGLDPNDAFLEKPFRPDALARKVREVLDAA